MLPQQYCLRWKYHHSNLQTMFSQLLDRGCFCDVTLACEGQLIRAHRVVLCACSTFFDTVLTNYASERDPIIIMKDVTFADVKALIEFMYKGEINVEHANLASLLKTADDLKIKGLAEVSWRDDEDVANGVSGGAPPPPADSEYITNSPSHRMHEGYSISGATAADMRGSPIHDSGGMERRSAASPIHNNNNNHNNKHHIPSRLPMLTPISSSSSITIASAASADHYLGPKRKRGRPPLDDAYDVFNVRKLTHYGNHLDSQPFIDSSRLHTAHSQDEQQQQHRHSASAYQQHIHQQQRRQRQKHEHKQHAADSDDADDNQTDPEWITSNLEVNVAECEAATAIGHVERESNGSPNERQNDKKLENIEKDQKPESPQSNDRERTPPEVKVNAEKNNPKAELRFKKRSVLEKAKEQRMRESKEREKMENKHNEDDKLSEHDDDNTPLLPQPIEEIESAQQHKTSNASGATTATNAISSSSSDLPSTSSQSKISQSNNSSSHSHSHGHAHAHAHAHSHPGPSISASHGHAHAHFSKYGAHGDAGGSGGGGGGPGGPGGYVLNEHGMLMTHDFSTHNAVLAAAAASNGDNDFVDIKMEDYDAADLRLTSEEMSQWQDVIKMDDYLAKGRRPQFWEEPFTRRVLDAIKNKRLEMKKAARILGVSYGTLYGRYREVYGCLKHPYSSTMRPSQSSQLSAVQPRFDIVWPSPKRDSGLLPAPLEIGKIRPKDLSELWARPQI